MGERLRIESPAKVIKRLETLGYAYDRSKGSHKQFICATRCHTATVAVHKRKDILERDIRSIIRQTGCTKDEFYLGIQKCKKSKTK